MKKLTAKEDLSDISGYSVEELRDRCIEVLIQPYDAELTAVKFAAQEVAEATKYLYTDKDVRLILLNYNLDCISAGENLLTADWFNKRKQPLPQPPTDKGSSTSNTPQP